MSGGVLGAVLLWTGLLWTGLLWTGLVWLGGLGVFALACKVSATEPRGWREARRIAAWRRVGPHVRAACSLPAAVGAALLVVYPR